MAYKLYIGGIPNDLDELSLAKLIAPHGDIVSMKIVCDRKTRVGKGYAFVEVVSEDAAAAVAEALHQTKFRSRVLDVKPADLPSTMAQPPARSVGPRQTSSEPGRELRNRRPRK